MNSVIITNMPQKEQKKFHLNPVLTCRYILETEFGVFHLDSVQQSHPRCNCVDLIGLIPGRKVFCMYEVYVLQMNLLIIFMV